MCVWLWLSVIPFVIAACHCKKWNGTNNWGPIPNSIYSQINQSNAISYWGWNGTTETQGKVWDQIPSNGKQHGSKYSLITLKQYFVSILLNSVFENLKIAKKKKKEIHSFGGRSFGVLLIWLGPLSNPSSTGSLARRWRWAVKLRKAERGRGRLSMKFSGKEGKQAKQTTLEMMNKMVEIPKVAFRKEIGLKAVRYNLFSKGLKHRACPRKKGLGHSDWFGQSDVGGQI